MNETMDGEKDPEAFRRFIFVKSPSYHGGDAQRNANHYKIRKSKAILIIPFDRTCAMAVTAGTCGESHHCECSENIKLESDTFYRCEFQMPKLNEASPTRKERLLPWQVPDPTNVAFGIVQDELLIWIESAAVP